MADRKRKRMVQQQPDRRANRTILVRTLFLLTLFGVAAFVPLLVRPWKHYAMIALIVAGIAIMGVFDL